jgi:hypothetical protein
VIKYEKKKLPLGILDFKDVVSRAYDSLAKTWIGGFLLVVGTWSQAESNRHLSLAKAAFSQ